MQGQFLQFDLRNSSLRRKYDGLKYRLKELEVRVGQRMCGQGLRLHDHVLFTAVALLAPRRPAVPAGCGDGCAPALHSISDAGGHGGGAVGHGRADPRRNMSLA
eukprot:364208-Chlamydomonas_euryale.AAC.22